MRFSTLGLPRTPCICFVIYNKKRKGTSCNKKSHINFNSGLHKLHLFVRTVVRSPYTNEINCQKDSLNDLYTQSGFVDGTCNYIAQHSVRMTTTSNTLTHIPSNNDCGHSYTVLQCVHFYRFAPLELLKVLQISQFRVNIISSEPVAAKYGSPDLRDLGRSIPLGSD